MIFVGVPISLEILEELYKISQEAKTEIEIYGSAKEDPLGQVRESSRLKQTVPLLEFIGEAKKRNLKFYYAANSPLLSPPILDKNAKQIEDFVLELKEAGCEGFIVSSVCLASKIKELGLKTIGSTVMNWRSIPQLRILRPYFDRVCIATDCNRDLAFLAFANQEIELEILVNELCLYSCPFRTLHYIQESQGLVSDFPISVCWHWFTSHPAEIIKARWVRPEDLFEYEHLGIRFFKISGRTISTERILKIVRAYALRRHEGNLLDLFPVVPGKIALEGHPTGIYLENSALDGILKMFRDCNGNCISCDFCEAFSRSLMKEGYLKIC